MSTKKRSWQRAARLALLLSSPLLLFGVGELIMRAVDEDGRAALPAAMAKRASEGETGAGGLPILQTVSDLTKPHVEGIFRGQVYRSDAIGFRGPNRPPIAPPGTRRVIVTGDSIPMGSGVPFEVAFPSVTESLLDAEASPPDWEVINAAIAGANLRTAVDRLEMGIDYYGGDVFVYPFIPNDIMGGFYKSFPAERTALDLIADVGWPARSSSALIRVTTWEWFDLWERIGQLNLDHYVHEIEYNYFDNPKAWAMYRLGLNRLARISKEQDRCVIVLMQTKLEALEPDIHPYSAIYDLVADEARARGLHVVETAPTMLRQDADKIRHSKLDSHPNATGHSILGRLLADGIRSLPESCWAHVADRP